jgi:hypothetical protein
MIFVNASDYLPTTEATGVRIAIHGRKEYPYPDAFGYNAPSTLSKPVRKRIISVFSWLRLVLWSFIGS